MLHNYICATPHYIQQVWVRWPLQLVQPLQETQFPFVPSAESLCHPCITTTHLSYSVLSLKLPPPPCAVLLVHLILSTRNFRLTISEQDRWTSSARKELEIELLLLSGESTILGFDSWKDLGSCSWRNKCIRCICLVTCHTLAQRVSLSTLPAGTWFNNRSFVETTFLNSLIVETTFLILFAKCASYLLHRPGRSSYVKLTNKTT